MNAFYNRNLDLSKLNHAETSLIPKVSDAVNIKQYRPISLINSSFKIISKILANRISTVMDFFIDNSQTAFIKGRNIFDSMVCTEEVPFSN